MKKLLLPMLKGGGSLDPQQLMGVFLEMEEDDAAAAAAWLTVLPPGYGLTLLRREAQGLPPAEPGGLF